MEKKALLIIDMSNDFVHENGSLTAGERAQNITAFIKEKAEEFVSEGASVYVCMDAHEEDDSHFQLWPKHNVKGTWGQALYGSLGEWFEANKNMDRVHYIGKSEYDAFHATDLEQKLKAEGVTDVYITGVCTDICVFLTTYGAYKAGFKTHVYEAGAATFTENHQVFLSQMKLNFQTNVIEGE